MLNSSSVPCLTDDCYEQSDDGGLSIPMYIGLYIALSNTLIFSVGIVCNVLVIVVVALYKKMYTTISFYLVNLSVADLCVLFVCQPVATLEYFNREKWVLGPVVCKIVPVLESATQHASTLTILAITFERMNAVCNPLAVFTQKKSHRTRKLIPIIWITAILLSTPFAGIAETTDVKFIDGTSGTICHAPIDAIWKKYFIVGSIVVFFLLIIVMGLLHVRIIRNLVRSAGFRRSSTTESFTRSSTNSPSDRIPLKKRNSLRNLSMSDDVIDPIRRRRAWASQPSVSTFSLVVVHRTQIKNLVFIVVYLIVSYMPMKVFILWQMFTLKQPADIGVETYLNLIWTFRLLIYVHSASNPFIYSFTSTKFMRYLKLLAKCGQTTRGRYIRPFYSTRYGD